MKRLVLFVLRSGYLYVRISLLISSSRATEPFLNGIGRCSINVYRESSFLERALAIEH